MSCVRSSQRPDQERSWRILLKGGGMRCSTAPLRHAIIKLKMEKGPRAFFLARTSKKGSYASNAHSLASTEAGKRGRRDPSVDPSSDEEVAA